MAAFDDFLEEVGDGRSQACWLLELDALPLVSSGAESCDFGDAGFGEQAFCDDDDGDFGGVVKLYYSSHGYSSRPADTPPNTWYDGRLAGAPLVERRIFDRREGFGGLTYTVAELELLNNDGELDTLTRDYALDGRAAALLLGRPADARSAYGQVFGGVMRFARISSSRVAVSLSDGLARLELPINRNTYAGTGSVEGGSDLKGKPKPKCWGHAFNVPAPLVDGASLVYQVHDGAVSDVPNVWDRQIALVKGSDYASQAEMEANAPAAGNYRVWKGGGFFRLGSTPSGTVTADVLGDAAGAGYINKTGDIVDRVLKDQALLTAAEIDAASIASLNTDAPAEVGIWRGAEPGTIAGALDDLLAGVGAFGGFSRQGKFTCGVIKTPSGAASASYTVAEIGRIEREPLPSAVEPLIWLARVAWQKSYLVQNDLAAGVTAARRSFAAERERVAKRDDVTVRSRRTLAREYGPTGNLYASQADADAEASRLMALWSVERGLYAVPLPAAALARDIGDVIDITYPRFGFSAGAQARVLGHELRGTRVTLKVFA